MKVVLSILIVGLGLIALPIQLFASYLLYQHVQASELMWFLWWAILPLTILITILSAIAKHYLDKDK